MTKQVLKSPVILHQVELTKLVTMREVAIFSSPAMKKGQDGDCFSLNF